MYYLSNFYYPFFSPASHDANLGKFLSGWSATPPATFRLRTSICPSYLKNGSVAKAVFSFIDIIYKKTFFHFLSALFINFIILSKSLSYKAISRFKFLFGFRHCLFMGNASASLQQFSAVGNDLSVKRFYPILHRHNN